MDYKEINKRFQKTLECIDNIINNDFYDDKGQLQDVKVIFEEWHNNFKDKKTLKTITPKQLEYVDLEITDIFDKYISKESIDSNYSERLSYDLSVLEKMWKKEMLGGTINVQ